MSTQNLKFIHLSTGSASAHKADTGAIIFEKATGRIAVATGANTDVEYYGGGRVSDATFDTEGKVLTLSFNDGSNAIKLDFSDTASATGVNAIMKAHADRISALETTVGDKDSGLVKAVADNKTAIDAINNKDTGILAEAKKYTDGKVGDIGTDVTVKKYVDDAKAAAIKDAKDYADGLVDNYDAAGAAAQALADAKAYTDGKVSEINTTTDGLRSDLGTRGDGKGTAFARIESLEGTVGNASSGLVKDVADNKSAITALQGLHADKDDKTGKKTVAEEVTAGVNAKVGDVGDGTVQAYVDAAKAAANKYTDDEVKKINSAANALDTRVNTLETKVGSSTDGADAEGSVYARIAKNAADIATLVGTDAAKSVRTIANEELVKQLIPEGAKESLDTLTEIAAWIQSHPDDASAMNGKITTLEKKVGSTDDEAAVDGSVYARIKKNAADIAGNLTKINANTNSISDHTTRIEALEGKHAPDRTVAQEVADGITAIKEASVSAGTDVVVTVKTKSGSVSEVDVNASALKKAVTDETTRATGIEQGLRADLGTKLETEGDAFTRIKALEKNQADGALMWSVWD